MKDEEEVDIRKATFDTARVFLDDLQRKQSENSGLMNLTRLEKLLVSLQQFEEVLKSFKTLPSPVEAMSFIWVCLSPSKQVACLVSFVNHRLIVLEGSLILIVAVSILSRFQIYPC